MENESNYIPPYLYHYTSVESLSLILKNRTIKLSPLSSMDDKQESMTSDLKRLGEFIFVSSWTEDDKESIPMWRMYTKHDAGVRIKMASNPFRRYKIGPEELAAYMGVKVHNEQNPGEEIITLLDLPKLIAQKAISPQVIGGDILVKVEYTDDLERLEPKTVDISNGETNIDNSWMGRVKSPYWSFQNEWRYIMGFMSMDITQPVEAIFTAFTRSVNELARDRKAPPFDSYFLEISEDAFKGMEIMKSPTISMANAEIVDLLVEKYNPSASVVESDLKGKL